MFVKRDERKDCSLYCSKRELLEEFGFQITAVVEKTAIDAEFLVYDLAEEIKESMAGFFSSGFYRRICCSAQRFPKMAAVLQMFVIQ